MDVSNINLSRLFGLRTVLICGALDGLRLTDRGSANLNPIGTVNEAI